MKNVALLSMMIAIVVGIGAVGSAEPSGAPADRVEQLAAMYDFANWPGKDGPVRDGFGIGRGVLPSNLDLGRAGEPRAYVDPENGRLSVQRRYTITRADGTGRITADVTVAGTCAEAQDKLMRLLVSGSKPQPPLIPKGTEHGLSLGDICFVAPAKEGGFRAVMWVRNNVLVRIAGHANDVRPSVEQLARALDIAISGRATFKSYAECASRPVIAGVAKVSGSEEVQRLEVDWKAVGVTAPQSEEVVYFPSHRVFAKERVRGRGWPSYQVAISESNLMGFPISRAAEWKTNGPRSSEVNAEVNAFLKTMARPAATGQ